MTASDRPKDDPNSPATFLCGMAIPSVNEGPAFGYCGHCNESGYLCPLCGAHCEAGYGLTGGGFGTWFACTVCPYFHKKLELER